MSTSSPFRAAAGEAVEHRGKAVAGDDPFLVNVGVQRGGVTGSDLQRRFPFPGRVHSPHLPEDAAVDLAVFEKSLVHAAGSDRGQLLGVAYGDDRSSRPFRSRAGCLGVSAGNAPTHLSCRLGGPAGCRCR